MQCLYNISRIKLSWSWFFYMQINVKVSYKLISTPWASKFPTRWYYHHWFFACRWTSIFYNLALSFLIEVARHVQSTQNWKLVIFWQYLKKKKCSKCLCVLLCCKILRYFTGVQSCPLLLLIMRYMGVQKLQNSQIGKAEFLKLWLLVKLIIYWATSHEQ